MSNSCGKFTLGLLLGAAAGFVASYFSDKEKRERFAEDFNEGMDKAKDLVLENYEEAKKRYEKACKRLRKETDELLESAEEYDVLAEEISEELNEE